MTSPDRILTTHTGSLPRTPELLAALGFGGEPAPEEEVARRVREEVEQAVAMQVSAGIDIVSDGELSKPSYSTYAAQRMSGFGGSATFKAVPKDVAEFPDWGGRASEAVKKKLKTPACVGDVRYDKPEFVASDLANFKAALAPHPGTQGFLTAASPGLLAMFLQNQHYAGHEEYLAALVTAMKEEYDSIHAAGYLIQLDCPDLTAFDRHAQFAEMSKKEYLATIQMNVEALNEATRDIPADRMRMHLCWGNYDGPHFHDVPLAEILDVVLGARPAAVSFELANPRHEHEWRLFEERELPDDKILVPGVIDSTSNYVEHPELVAERITRLAKLVGRERVIAGTDCGFSTFAGYTPVFPSVVVAKLKRSPKGLRSRRSAFDYRAESAQCASERLGLFA